MLRVTAHVSYDIQPDQRPVHVSWQVTVEDNDPQTARDGGGTISFYDSVSLPILRGATDISALSPAGKPLTVTVDNSAPGPLLVATVVFDRLLYYHDTYNLSLDYSLPSARDQSLLVTPFYVFLPAVASGDQATVVIATPNGPPWQVNLEPVDCTQNGASFSCAGSDSVRVAAFAEVSRPDATATIPIGLSLGEKNVSVNLTYFQGEEAWAQHLQQLVTAALPVIEDLYGFPYSGPFAINIAEGGRQVILGYEGLTSCDPQTSCDIAISPVADDLTALHELAHLWSNIYARRWLVEGFAELMAREAAAHLPPGLVQPPSSQRPPAADLDLRLDQWPDISSGAPSEADRQADSAGYDRSLRFLTLLKDQLGLDTLQRANAAIAQSGQPADSRRFMDTLEEVSGGNLDQLFARWVFPDSYGPILQARRQGRDRLSAVAAQAQAEGLSGDIPENIRQDIAGWRFEEALAALDRAEAALTTYAEIRDGLARLRSDVQAAGLSFPKVIDDALANWDFEAARLALADARRAVDAYTAARDKVDAPRSLWRRIGLLGSDPGSDLDEAAFAFARGDFQTAIDRANSAAGAIDDASQTALIRVLIFLAVLTSAGGAIGIAFWLSSRRFERPAKTRRPR
ncbi:MAG: hypothetical protein HYY03_02330 [Chloroflexi bacterium]|nr:hypothetical protein [Chloroflexota bacterium]